MNSTKTMTAAQIPSTIGMPITGSASGSALGRSIVGTVAVAADHCALTTSVVRDRAFAAGTGSIVSPTQAYFPGTSAWRPPSC